MNAMQAKRVEGDDGSDRWGPTTSEPALRVVQPVDNHDIHDNDGPAPVDARAATPTNVLAALQADGWRRVHHLRRMGARFIVERMFDGVKVSLSCRRASGGLTLLVPAGAPAVERWLRLWLSERGLVGAAIVAEAPEDRFPWMSVAVAASAIALFVWIVALR